MPFFSNRRVEEDLERIRKANLPDKNDIGEEVIDSEIGETFETAENIETVDIGFTAKDVLAMIIAAFSIIIPYALLFIGIGIVFVYFFFR